MKTLSVFFAISFLLPQTILLASDNDTVRIESPYEAFKRDANRIIKNRCVKIQKNIEDAAERLKIAPLVKSAEYISSLSEIINGLDPKDIIITETIKTEYLAELQKRYIDLQEKYDDADQAITMSYFLQKFLPFYVQDRSAYHYLDSLTEVQQDSIHIIYLKENGPEERGRYYFMDWLWLKLHNQLPVIKKKEEKIVEGYSEPIG